MSIAPELPPTPEEIIDRVENLLLATELAGKPVEVDPYRSGLFELFAAAQRAGYLDEGADPDLSSDGISPILARRWNLYEAAQNAFRQQSKMTPDQLGRMRLLWSFLRLWMEWSYAWERWPEFHRDEASGAT